LIKILPWRDDLNATEELKRQQILVAGDDKVCVAGEGALKDEVVVGVTADTGQTSCNAYAVGLCKERDKFLLNVERVDGELFIEDSEYLYFKFIAGDKGVVIYGMKQCGKRDASELDG
jgi:hypothetical protein